MNGVRVLQEQLGAESTLRDQTGLDGHCGIRPVSSWVMNLSGSLLPPRLLPLSHMFVNIHCCAMILIYVLFVCVGLRGTNFLSGVSGPSSAERFSFGLGVYFCLWQPAMTLISLRTLWDSGCIQVVMGYIKRKWIHMWGLALVSACWRCWVKEQGGRRLAHRGPLVVTAWKYTQLGLIMILGGIWNSWIKTLTQRILLCWRVIWGRRYS